MEMASMKTYLIDYLTDGAVIKQPVGKIYTQTSIIHF